MYSLLMTRCQIFGGLLIMLRYLSLTSSTSLRNFHSLYALEGLLLSLEKLLPDKLVFQAGDATGLEVEDTQFARGSSLDLKTPGVLCLSILLNVLIVSLHSV
eukprot:gb/GECG01013903.1/.p1 GENE.gb/GECG01013903.1/~~gb/GECG01013903.1/.p1  ORF type:complete len:102 (+),score=7.79 gb/GECG01013903.1/:1-306(+)